MPSASKRKAFKNAVWEFYRTHARHGLPWRTDTRPYRIWVSEVMLQQTQVDRVVSFFNAWMKRFPTVQKLAAASQGDVLKMWKGLGYNSRAIRMKKAAEIIAATQKGVFPKDYDAIRELPGVGPYTAGAICAFAYNKPIAVIETNIRRAFLHHFFKDQENVHDRDILKIVEETVDTENPREWYWALMDYGSHLGRTIPNPNKKSRHYAVQKKFKGSDREIRGKVLEILLKKNRASLDSVFKELAALSEDRDRIESIIDKMEKEGFLDISKNTLILKG